MDRKRHFIGAQAPLGYVPGLGRGATGFTTRSDIGPARDVGDAPDDRHPKKRKIGEEDPVAEEDLNDVHYDNFAGYSGSICGSDPYDKDDEEADEIYLEVDRRMDGRRREAREKKLKEQMDTYRRDNPKVHQLVSDLKADLTMISEEEWMNMPEAGDSRNKRARNPRQEKYTPVPDSILSRNAGMGALNTTLDPREQLYGGLATPALGAATPAVDIGGMGRARNVLMDLKLDQASATRLRGAASAVDPRGYLTELQSAMSDRSMNVGNVELAREFAKSLRETNPLEAKGWIASAAIEEAAGKLAAARKLIMEGCRTCPDSEDLCQHAARLLAPDTARGVVMNSLKLVPKSVGLWMTAVSLETKTTSKKKILRQALSAVGNSDVLWRAAVDLEENEGDARIMLGRAVELCPYNVEMWLALARLETYEQAKAVLNRARASVPTERQIWIASARLEEANGNGHRLQKLIENSLKSLASLGVEIKREQWYEDAKSAERSGHVQTCRAIVFNVAGIDVDEEDRMDTWLNDAESFATGGSLECARAVYNHALIQLRERQKVWLSAAEFEYNLGTTESLETLLRLAVKHFPQAEELWLRGAKKKKLAGELSDAREILNRASQLIPDSENVWLAAAKIEEELDDYDGARDKLRRARTVVGSARVLVKSVKLEWCLGEIECATALLAESLGRFPTEARFWMMKGQIERQRGDAEAVKDAYRQGIKQCPKSLPLWLLLVREEEQSGTLIRARAMLEKARLGIPDPQLWLEAIRLELRNDLKAAAQNLMARALRQFPKSGLLWAEAVLMEDRKQRKFKSSLAFKTCGDDAHLLLVGAKLLWAERKVDKAREWFGRTVRLDPDFGDAWANFHKFETVHGSEEGRREVGSRCAASDPHHGELWCRVSKDVRNWKLSVTEVLVKVAELVPVPM